MELARAANLLCFPVTLHTGEIQMNGMVPGGWQVPGGWHGPWGMAQSLGDGTS